MGLQSGVRHVFQCSEISINELMIPAHLVMTSKHLIKVREHPESPDVGVVMWRRSIVDLLKITSKKKMPSLLTMTFECQEGEVPTKPVKPQTDGASARAGAEHAEDEDCVVERFMIPQYMDAKQALTTLVDENRNSSK